MDNLAVRVTVVAGLLNVLAAFAATQVLPQAVSDDSPLLNNPVTEMLESHWNNLLSTTLLVGAVAGAAAYIAQRKTT